MTKQIKATAEDNMKKGLDSLKRELSKVRTGKAHTSMLDVIKELLRTSDSTFSSGCIELP